MYILDAKKYVTANSDTDDVEIKYIKKGVVGIGNIKIKASIKISITIFPDNVMSINLLKIQFKLKQSF
jgi:hypothetical protein